MGNKSQKRKERHEQKRKEKRKQQAPARARQVEIQQTGMAALGSNTRHRQRLSQQLPQAWVGETPEDVAVFDDSMLATLPPELAQQVSLVRQALQMASESLGDEALKHVSVIPRGSPLSEWRLFIRGLVDWLANDTAAANAAWERLDPERRPGRIAIAMTLALHSDLEQLSHPPQKNGELENASLGGRWDDQLLYHAKLLRRVRFDRTALRVAEAGLKMPEESSKLLLGPKKVQWLRAFIKEYGDTEPDLAAALSQTALNRAFAQDYSNLFDDAAKSFSGPRHDRGNQLLTFFYYDRFGNDAKAEKKSNEALDRYLSQDLPQNKSLPESLRSAIAGQIHLNEAISLMTPDFGGGLMALVFAQPEDTKAVRTHLKAALKATPGNLAAYKAYVNWLESKLENDRLTKPQQTSLEKELTTVMRSWSRGLPEDVEPRLWLVDYLLENEELEEARPHVDFLAASRHDDPRVRATPWKWQLLEAMRLCRRKAWLADVPARLDEVEALWPAWLPKQWLPYLRAAWTLRMGQADEFETQRQQICEASGRARDSLADACMMLGAAQRMRVPAEDLKRLRAPVDQAAKKLDQLSLDDLVDAGGFFWDLSRVQLLYPAYRMHGSKFGQALIARWKKTPGAVLEKIQDERVHKAVLWASQSRFWSSNYEITLPPFYSSLEILKHPIFTAARLNAFLKGRYHWRSERYQECGPLLRSAAESQRDAYYRYWFTALADELDEILSRKAPKQFGFPFGNPFENDDEDDDENRDLDFDPDCNCPECQAARQASGKQGV